MLADLVLKKEVAASQTVTETKRLKFRLLLLKMHHLQRDNLMTEDQSRADVL